GLAVQEPEQRRLAGAVRAGERDAVAALDLERDGVEERLAGELLAQVGCRDDGHGHSVEVSAASDSARNWLRRVRSGAIRSARVAGGTLPPHPGGDVLRFRAPSRRVGQRVAPTVLATSSRAAVAMCSASIPAAASSSAGVPEPGMSRTARWTTLGRSSE